MRRRWAWAAVVVALLLRATPVLAADPETPLPLPKLQIGLGTAGGPADLVLSLQILVILTVLTLAPALLMLTTAFTRIVVVLSFLRSSLSTQQMPPNQVLLGLALFLTFFVMQPTLSRMNEQALQPYLKGDITQADAMNRGVQPLREFMARQTREADLALFIDLAGVPRPAGMEGVPTYVLVPAFAISELKTAFQMGFLLFIPFVVIDIVVSSTLMSMGMVMLPPAMISLPFKILLFVLVDGWHLVVQQLVLSFK